MNTQKKNSGKKCVSLRNNLEKLTKLGDVVPIFPPLGDGISTRV